MSRYPGYDVLDKWRSPSFDDKTRAVVRARLRPPPAPQFFSPEAFATLEAVVARLIPQPDRTEPIPLAPWIDHRLAHGLGDGYWTDGLPPGPEAWRIGIAGIDAEARRRFGQGFAALSAEQQDATLHAVQAGEVDLAAWPGLDPKRFFKDPLLKTTAGLYYTHPLAWSEIGFGGPASPRGYVRLGFNERDPWEAQERK